MITFFSFDVGEKNFAYCIGTINNEKEAIIKEIGHHDVKKKRIKQLSTLVFSSPKY